MQLEKLF